jgi:hypothetical protein
MLNIKDLKNSCILAVKYIKNKQVVPKLPRQKISNSVKDMIVEVCENGEFSKDCFDILSADDQKIFITFVQMCNLDIGYDIILDESDDFDKEYQQLLSKWKCGIASVDTGKKLRKLIIQGIQKKKLPLQSSLILLAKLE